MKTYTSIVLMITICTLTFSCHKDGDIKNTTCPGKGSVVFWTKNAANLTTCSNDIEIRASAGDRWFVFIIDTVHIINVNATAPSSCSNIPSAIENLYPCQSYSYQVKDCTTGLWGNNVDFSIVALECLKIEIP